MSAGIMKTDAVNSDATKDRNMIKIEHIALYVNDLQAARDFFMKYLDGRSNEEYHNPRTDFHSYFISFGDGTRLLDHE